MAKQDDRVSVAPTIVSDGGETHEINEDFQHRLFPGRKEYEGDEHLVEFDPDDPLNPMVGSRAPIQDVRGNAPVCRIGQDHTDGS